MKTEENQIIQILQAFKPENVLLAFKLYKYDYENNLNSIEEKLLKEGWVSQEQKPETNIPYHFINKKYWVLSEEARQKKIKEKVEAMKKSAQEKNASTETKSKKKKVSYNLKETSIRCPSCQSKTYKQAVCPMCKEGKQGYKIRLICEENPDHEILL